jgi:hypothetical protein
MALRNRGAKSQVAVAALLVVAMALMSEWDLGLTQYLPSTSTVADDGIATTSKGNISNIISWSDSIVDIIGTMSMPSFSAPNATAASSREEAPAGPSLSRSSIGGTASSYIDAKISRVLQNFEQRKGQLRFYIYEDPRLQEFGKPYLPYHKSFKEFAVTEEEILHVMKNHSLRTMDPDEASWYIIPFSLQRHVINNGGRNGDAVFAPLYNQTIFQQKLGHRHLMLAQNPNLFSLFHAPAYRINRMTQQYPMLYNVTIARAVDADGCQESLQEGVLTPTSDFGNVMISCAKHATRSSFSTGFVPQRNFAFIPATYEKFMNSSVFVFYHSRIEPSWNNSTQYRHALLNESIVAAMKNSSIGMDMDPSEWFQKYTSSRFCMVIRGDNPTSRAHLRTVKVGCIPVIVSDTLPYYAPAMKSSISVSDYSIMISEATFLKDAMGSLSVLSVLTEDEIRGKMKALAFAQRLLLPDHPESLFVPALMWESEVAYTHRLNSTRYPWRTAGASNPRGPR